MPGSSAKFSDGRRFLSLRRCLAHHTGVALNDTMKPTTTTTTSSKRRRGGAERDEESRKFFFSWKLAGAHNKAKQQSNASKITTQQQRRQQQQQLLKYSSGDDDDDDVEEEGVSKLQLAELLGINDDEKKDDRYEVLSEGEDGEDESAPDLASFVESAPNLHDDSHPDKYLPLSELFKTHPLGKQIKTLTLTPPPRPPVIIHNNCDRCCFRAWAWGPSQFSSCQD